ncbi:M20/M25/M40 family metallo-hydrolase [Thermasporomyces composti]|jgi:acetylornithine deacetylase/succinyl-diaminopimelate desuccinylase-like protein|uniref:Acetylornithine deacetylase/succinyl-diaminopimelate desuccinylase-like protein n=1 Tax=Thermasporomyces composti TaxID=696763 RepID=A0A3D9V996_THECX|nr:M20/M25/M40 family metallo-hydrolase [Thermasporomyces composti]REF38332.1 acetylornithine deacetylase/succinyl-diaminopimelate desuccinylase-like protein [Thermasporomyces composti]
MTNDASGHAAQPAGAGADVEHRPDAEVVEICRDLIRIDTSNYGDDRGPGERQAAEYVAGKLAEAGLEPTLLESEPLRTTVVARWEGADPSLPALLVHGHLDVVPAVKADWSVDPFAGEVKDGCLWGRGAVDMKDFDAMVLSVLSARTRAGRPPRRPVVLVFTADEEAGGRKGAHWLVDHHPELLEGCTEAVGEVGGFSVTVRDDLRFYLIQTAEKGMAWMRLRARGTAGHGSMRNDDNAVTELAEAVARIGRHRFPPRITPPVKAFLAEVSEALGVDIDPESDDVEVTLARLGSVARMIGATLRNTANPTMLDAGYKVNVIPGEATAAVDGRFVPGGQEEFLATIDELIGDKVTREMINLDSAPETEFAGALVDAMRTSLAAEDPQGRAVPYLMSGGTDAKAWHRLGIRCFGFAPLKLPPDLDFVGMFHGIDERVPVESLRFGARVLDRFLDLA